MKMCLNFHLNIRCEILGVFLKKFKDQKSIMVQFKKIKDRMY